MKRTAGFALTVSLALVGRGTAAYAQQAPTIYDEHLKLVDFEALDYPAAARNAKVQGTVVIQVRLDDKGHVAEASVLSGSPLLIRQAVANARKWKFKPNVYMSAVIVYEFRLDPGPCKDDSRSLFRMAHINVAEVTACTPVV